MSEARRAYAVVTGGGTSGHVLPAIAVAEALVASGHEPSTVHYVGAQRGIETTLLPDTPFPSHFFDVVGFQRRMSRRNASFAPKMFRARNEAVTLLRALSPKVVVSVGGYASMPAVFAARALHVPVVVVSYDRFPGKASALAARRAAACAVAFPESTLPRVVLTGAPIRHAVLDVDRARDRESARNQLGVPEDRFLVVVIGGSQGSGVLNDTINAILDGAGNDEKLAVLHLVGDRFMNTARPGLEDGDGVWYRPVGYERRMPQIYAAADLIIGRGGASTVHEVAVTGTPAILVPWAASAEDHQTANVKWLADQGGAIMVAESQLATLGAVVAGLRSTPEQLAELGHQAARLGAVHRSGALAHLIESVASRS